MCTYCSLPALEGAEIDLGSTGSYTATETQHPGFQNQGLNYIGETAPLATGGFAAEINALLWRSRWSVDDLTYSFPSAVEHFQPSHPTEQFNFGQELYWSDGNMNGYNGVYELANAFTSGQVASARF